MVCERMDYMSELVIQTDALTKRYGDILAVDAHAFAWAAGVFFAFGPVYQGASVTPTLPGEPGGEVTRYSALRQ